MSVLFLIAVVLLILLNGFFVSCEFSLVRTRRGLQPYAIFARLRSAPADAVVHESVAAPGPETMTISALGAFRCEIGGRPVKFLRRRDQHVRDGPRAGPRHLHGV